MECLELLEKDPDLIFDIHHNIERIVKYSTKEIESILKNISVNSKINISKLHKNGITIYTNRQTIASIQSLEGYNKNIIQTPRHIFYYILSGKIEYNKYSIKDYNSIEIHNSIMNKIELKEKESGTKKSGDHLYIDGKNEAILIKNCSDAVILSIITGLFSPLSFEFDSESLKCISQISSDATFNQHEFLLEAIYECELNIDANILEKLLNSPAHFVRWSAYRSILNSNPTKIRHYILQMKMDPHPEIRNIADILSKRAEGV